ncbi:MAG TPA: YetF domain-containing protein, partial [Motilibacteraceae bacterium]|nr:YetF domain-containing protein [Motilibacteraceae bacterium]
VVALLTLLATHGAATFVRYHPQVGTAVDHRVRVLVDHGRLRRRQLVITGLTENDVLAKLRQLGHEDLSQLRYVLYETKGELTVVPERGADVPDPPLVRRGLRDAAGYEGRSP